MANLLFMFNIHIFEAVFSYSLDKMKPKIKTKNQNIFVDVNKHLTTFLYTLNKGDKKNFFRRGKNSFLVLLFKVYNRVEMSTTKKFGF